MRGVILALILSLATACSGIEYTHHAPQDPCVGPDNAPLHEPEWFTDVIHQVPTPEVNLLFVIDNSCSMSDDQAQLAANMPPLIEELDAANVNYRVGITTTSSTSYLSEFWGKKWIDRDTPDPVGTFSTGVMVGLSGGIEKGLYSTYLTIADEYNSDFFRINSPLHIFVVSDEPDQTVEETNITADEFWSLMVAQKGLSGGLTFTTIADFPDSPNCPHPYADPSRYVRVTSLFPGQLIEICAEDWSAPIDRITDDVMDLKYRYYLTQIPVPETIEVYIERLGVTYRYHEPEDWTYDQVSNSIELQKLVPDEHSVFIAEYILADSTYDMQDNTLP